MGVNQISNAYRISNRVVSCDEVAFSVVCYAAESGNLDLVKYLGDKGIDFSAADTGSNTFMLCAVKGGNLDLVKYFVGKRVGFSSKDVNSGALIYYATKNGNLELVKYLVEEVRVSVKGAFY
ncbi:ankyrin repeat domain-containing protein [Wolbachia endosymbiont of Armadillidium arcangelii]|uniref:Ankyrin repeat domain-containing protein n=1 Tax=Wolbachia endosymbiont of Armadillidium arcangelii TaxID=3158571 RepID=A0AAU7Q3J8_9RICK